MADKTTKDADAVRTKIADMAPDDRKLAERIAALVADAAPELAPKLWYGQPAWARKGKVVCFFRSGHDDQERYSTFGFTPHAQLDERGGLWPTSYAVEQLTKKGEQELAERVKQAAG